MVFDEVFGSARVDESGGDDFLGAQPDYSPQCQMGNGWETAGGGDETR